MNLQKIKAKLLKFFIIGMILISIILMLLDIQGFWAAATEFETVFLPIIIILAVLNFVVRFIKWEYYLKQLNIDISKKDSLKIYLSGLPMTITPGKVGELFKSYLLKTKHRYPISTTSPMIILERVTDLIGVLLLAGIGALAFNFGVGLLAFILGLITIGIIIVQSQKLCYKIINLISLIPFIRKYVPSITNFYESACSLLNIRILLSAVGIGMLAWICEGLIVYFVVKGTINEISILYSIFIFALSSLIGVISMLPGGVVASEGSMLALLLQKGISQGSAGFIVLLVRMFTLWMGVIIGSIVLIKVETELQEQGFEHDGIIEGTESEIIENKRLQDEEKDK